MLVSKAGNISIILLIISLSACSKVNDAGMLSLMQNAKMQGKLEDGFQLASVLNHSPRVLIAKPKPKVRKKRSNTGNLFSKLIGGSQSRTTDGGYRNDPSARQGPAGPSGFDGIFGGPKYSTEDNYDDATELTELYESDIVLPVASTAYGKDLTIIKSVNGGFGMLLLNQGHHHNILACRALFQSLPTKSNVEIDFAAKNKSGLFRPTYWLDRREKPTEQKAKKTEIVSSNQLLHLASNNYFEKGNVVKTKIVKQNGESCIKKLDFYNYNVSNILLNRLNLKGTGPYLAAWRDDAKKAMILDLGNLKDQSSYNKAMSAWIKLIVRHPELWQEGTVQNANFKKELGPMIRDNSRSILALMALKKEGKN